MTAIDPNFGRKARDAGAVAIAYPQPMIRITMNGRDWAILGALALIWGGAFFLIGVAVRHVPPFTYVLLRLTIAAAAMWAILAWRRETLALPREAWSAIVLLALWRCESTSWRLTTAAKRSLSFPSATTGIASRPPRA